MSLLEHESYRDDANLGQVAGAGSPGGAVEERGGAFDEEGVRWLGSPALRPRPRALVALTSASLACAIAACSGGSGSQNACVSSTASPLGSAVCPGAAIVRGVDVSVYQGRIDWSQTKAAGVSFAFARVSDGTGYSDTEFAANWPAMKAAGVVRGAYQFFRPGEDPTAQATLFASMLSAAGGIGAGDLPAVMDLEVTDGLSDMTIQSRMQTWFSAMQQATGMTPMLYLSPSFASHAGTGFGMHALWIANWGVPCPSVPAAWSTWAFWQDSDMGKVTGIPAAVDLDEFDGPLAALPVLGAPGPAGDAGAVVGAPVDAGEEQAPDSGRSSPPADGAAPVRNDAGGAANAGSGQGAVMGSQGSPGPCR